LKIALTANKRWFNQNFPALLSQTKKEQLEANWHVQHLRWGLTWQDQWALALHNCMNSQRSRVGRF